MMSNLLAPLACAAVIIAPLSILALLLRGVPWRILEPVVIALMVAAFIALAAYTWIPAATGM